MEIDLMLKRIAVLAFLTFASEAQAETPGDFHEVKGPSGYAPALSGIWRSEGYGYLISLTPDKLTLYHEAGGMCLADSRDSDDPDSQFVLWRDLGPAQPRQHIAFNGGREDTRYVFNRIDALPAACTRSVAVTPEQRFAFATATLKAYYPSFERRGVTWDKLLADVRGRHPQIKTDAQAWAALSEIFTALNDPHTGLHGTIDGEAVEVDPGEAATLTAIAASTIEGKTGKDAIKLWLRAWRDGVLNGILDGKGHEAANSRIFWGRTGDVGYITLLTMGAFDADADPMDTKALDATLDEAMTAFAGARAVVVDVSNNRGGYDTISRTIASRFAVKETLAFTKQPAGSPGTEAQAFSLHPSSRPRYLGPVYLLTRDITVSAGETFTAYMNSQPQVTQVGTATRGALSDQIEKPLGDGWSFTLSAEIYTDARGTWAEGTGFAPDVRLDLYGGPNVLTSHRDTVKSLINRISPDGSLRP